MRSVFTVPTETIAWLPKEQDKAAFIPIGANIPERVNRRVPSGSARQTKTVIVFGVTEPPKSVREAEEIAGVMKDASKAVPRLRLVVVGRGAVEARGQLEKLLGRCSVELVVRGVLPAEEIAREFECADALLFVRGPLALGRGSALAGIACGVPIIAYRTGEVTEPLQEAGVAWSVWRDRDALVREVVRVLSDPSYWAELHRRNLEVQSNYFSWDRIAGRFLTELGR